MEVKSYEIANEMIYKNTNVMKYSIQYPQFSDRHHGLIARRLSRYYYESALETAKSCETGFYREAVSYYDETLKQSYPFHEYEFNVTFTVTQNDGCVLSLYFDEERYTGGANGTNKRVADNWSLSMGRRIPLASLYPDEQDFARLILNEVIRQMSAAPDDYFNHYAKLAEQNFDAENFYLKPDALTVFYQEITVAPHSSGVVPFDISYAPGPVRPVCEAAYFG